MTTNTFLPENYEIPTKPFFKFETGKNLFRVLDSPIIGWQAWDDEKNVHRFRMDNKPAKPLGKQPVKHMWCLKVWNYKTNRVEVLEITQSSIQEAIKEISGNAKWGSPLGYDIEVTRTGEGINTEYTVVPEPHTALTEAQELAFGDTYCNLEAMYEGKDPFSKE